MNATSKLAPKVVAGSDIVVQLTPRSRIGEDARLEHVPVNFYHLLRQLARGPLPLRELHGVEIEAAIVFLVSRGLARRQNGNLVITAGGRRIGQVPNDAGLGIAPTKPSTDLKDGDSDE